MSYYQMQRGWQDHHLFAGDKYSRRDAWEWLVANAAWKDTSTGYHGKKITLKRGQLAHSIRFLAEKWGWTASKVQRFLCSLKTDTMIDTATDTGRLLITICNYDIFQNKINLCDTATDTTSDTPPIQQRYKEEEDKKERKERKSARVTLDELSVDHIGDWLAQKRNEGKYLDHDENHIIEVFVNYCKSKGKTYVDYVAALQNAFDWDRCSPKVGRARSEIKGNVITL